MSSFSPASAAFDDERRGSNRKQCSELETKKFPRYLHFRMCIHVQRITVYTTAAVAASELDGGGRISGAHLSNITGI